MNHDIFLSDIATSMPEVNAAFLLTPQGGVLTQHIGETATSINPQIIGGKILTIAAGALVKTPDITHIQVSFDTMILSARRLPDHNWLFLLHQPELSAGMIKMALQLALNNSEQGNDVPAVAVEALAADPAVDQPLIEEEAATQQPSQADTEALMLAGAPLAAPLNAMQDALAELIGPAALIVFPDVLVTWQQQHTPDLNTLKHLIPLIEVEIGDAADIKVFHKNIQAILPQE